MKKTDGYEVGDVVVGAWGYDQTNIYFYKVMKRTEKTITIQRMTSVQTKLNEFMSAYVVPGELITDPEVYGFEITRRKLVRYGDDDAIHGCKFADSYGWISAWDGEPKYESWYA